MVTESSMANLRKGSLKTKGGGAIRKTLSLHPDSVEWLEQQPNMSSAIDKLIAERSRKTKSKNNTKK